MTKPRKKAADVTAEYPFIACTPKRLPADKRVAAARHAVSVNPANAPNLVGLTEAGGGIPTRERIAVVTTKWWGPGGVHLSVGVFQKITQKFMDKLLLYANKWGQGPSAANVQFTQAPVAQADVRIDLSGDGYWSYLGTDIRQIAKGQPTMTLEGFSLDAPDSEYERVVTHEFGHTLGAPHEHMRGEIIALLDPEKVIAEFERSQGWSRDEVIAQILTPISEGSLTGATPHAEVDSVMCYQLPGSVTKNGQPVPGGSRISDDDALFMSRIYPRTITPPSPPGTGKWSIAVPGPCIISGTGVKPVVG